MLAIVAAARTDALLHVPRDAALTAGFQLAFLVAAGLACLGALSAGLQLRPEYKQKLRHVFLALT